MKPTFKRIKWRGHNLTVEGYADGNDVELTSIEGITPLEMYEDASAESHGEIERLFAESVAESVNDYFD
jgi:hypothetical protein